jgi:hypothetical protein
MWPVATFDAIAHGFGRVSLLSCGRVLHDARQDPVSGEMGTIVTHRSSAGAFKNWLPESNSGLPISIPDGHGRT